MRLEVRYDDAAARGAMSKVHRVISRRLRFALERGAQELAREARGRAPKAFSTLTNSIRAMRENDLHWFVAPGVNYGAWVEGGRMPMRKTGFQNGLLEWIKLKVAPGASGKELDRLGFVIRRAIGRRGIHPHPFMAPAFEAKKARVVELANAAVREAVAEINGGGRVV